MNDFPEGHPFFGVEGKDGFHVLKTHGPTDVYLSCVAYGGGVPCNVVSDDPNITSAEILKVSLNASQAELAGLDRLHMVLDAVTRFLNTGGRWNELSAALFVLHRVVPNGIHFAGYHYCRSDLTTDGYQHVFVADDGSDQAVLWQEPTTGDSGVPVGGWVAPTTLTDLIDQTNEYDADGTEF